MDRPFREHELNLIKGLLPAHFYHSIVRMNKHPEEIAQLKKRIEELENPVVFRFREHRGSLEDSLATEKVLTSNSKDVLIDCIKEILNTYPIDVDEAKVTIEPYTKGGRTFGWKDTYIVSLRFYGVIGFTNYMPV